MRKRFELQYELGATPIEKVKIPSRSRDELPPVLRALQHIYTTDELNKAVFDLLESRIIGDANNRMGRPGMKLLDSYVMERECDVDVAVPLGDRLIDHWGRLSSLSFDRGFWSPENYRHLCYQVEELIMPKKGGKTKTEQERESREAFIRLRCEHAGVESDINALEHHGLNRCPDSGLTNFRRYVALGILASNLHRLGNLLLAWDRKTATHRAAA